MKKILAFLLAATLLCAIFVLPSFADDAVNYATDINYIEEAPKIDGKVDKREYGNLPVHSYPEDKEQFKDTEHNEFDDWGFDFYAAWDKDYLYMAWVVDTPRGPSFPEEDKTSDGVFDSGDYGYMWERSCVQFIFTPGAPEKGKTTYQSTADYLEVGLALTTTGQQCRVSWAKPKNAAALDPNDWDAVITHDEGKSMTYEVRIPWNKSGVAEAGTGAQFGLTYAVASQEDYNTKKGMIEWQDGVLGTKDADAAATITLAGGKVDVTQVTPSSVVPELAEGQLPADAEGKVQLGIDAVDVTVTAESAVLFTSPSKISNTKYSYNLLLKPVDGLYEVVEGKNGNGEEVVFDSAIEDGMLVAAFHTDGTEGAAGAARREAAAALVAGDKLALFGVDLTKGELLYSNAMFYVADAATDVSGTESSEEPSEAESSEAPSEAESVAESSTVASSVAESSVAEENEEGSLLWLWIVIGVVAVAAVVVVVIVLKKKKA